MATEKYDGAKNTFEVPQETLEANAARLQMSPTEYKTMLNDFVRSYSSNPLFAYQHTDLSDVPVTFDTSEKYPTSDGGYSPAAKSVRITPSKDPDRMMRTLLHELTHAGQDRAGLFKDEEAALRTQLSQHSEMGTNRVARALSYGPGELAAFIVESMHPATKAGRDWRIGEMIHSNPRESQDLFSRAAQPTRPVTSHPTQAPKLNSIEKLKQMLFYSRK